MFPQGLSTPVSMVYDVLRETYIEALIIGVAMLFYLRLAKLCEPYVWRRLGSKGCKDVGAGTDALHTRPVPQPSSPVKEASKVQSFFSSLAGSGSPSDCRYIVGQYEHLVRARRADLAEHLFDKKAATAAFAIIVEATVQVADSSSKEQILRLLGDMRTFGFPRTRDFYTKVVNSLLHRQLFQDMLWIHDVMVAEGLALDRMLCNGFLTAAVACNEDLKAAKFFKASCKAGNASLRTCMTVLRVFAKSNDWRGAVSTLAGLKSSGGVPDALALNAVLGICIAAGKLEVGEQLADEWREQVDTVSCNILLKGFAKKAAMDKAEVLLDCMLTSGPPPNVITFNTVMDCCVRSFQQVLRTPAWSQHRCAEGTSSKQVLKAEGSRGVSKIWKFLDQLEKMGLEPDRYTCSTLVKGLHLAGCSQADIDGAVSLIKRVDLSTAAKAHDPNGRLVEVIFNSLLDECVNIGDLDRMNEVFGVMMNSKAVVSAVTFATLIKAFGHAGQLDACHEVWSNMHKAKVRPTVVSYGCYIDACLKNKDVAKAINVFASMADSGVSPNSVVYAILIRGCAQARDPIRALTFYQQMLRVGIEPTAVTFNSVLDIIARQLADFDSHKLEEVMDDMQKAGVQPDSVTYSILMKATCSSGHVSEAIALFRRLRTHGIAFDDVSFNALLLACSKAKMVNDAEDIFNDMLADGVAPTLVTISVLVNMYGQSRMLDKALGVTKVLEGRFGIQPNLYLFTCLIQACVRNRQLRKSWQVFGQMILKGVLPDAITYGTVIHGCCYHSKFDEAMAFVRHAYGVRAPAGSPAKSLASLLEISQDVLGHRDQALVLQEEVLRALSKALQRKGQTALLKELDPFLGQYFGHSAVERSSTWAEAGARKHGSACSSLFSDFAEDGHGHRRVRRFD